MSILPELHEFVQGLPATTRVKTILCNILEYESGATTVEELRQEVVSGKFALYYGAGEKCLMALHAGFGGRS